MRFVLLQLVHIDLITSLCNAYFVGKRSCEACQKKCKGHVVKLQEKYFHVKCFKCKGELNFFLIICPYIIKVCGCCYCYICRSYFIVTNSTCLIHSYL